MQKAAGISATDARTGAEAGMPEVPMADGSVSLMTEAENDADTEIPLPEKIRGANGTTVPGAAMAPDAVRRKTPDTGKKTDASVDYRENSELLPGNSLAAAYFFEDLS